MILSPECGKPEEEKDDAEQIRNQIDSDLWDESLFKKGVLMTDSKVFEKWAEAVLYVADSEGMRDDQEIDTWPRDVKDQYPALTIGAVRGWPASNALDAVASAAKGART